MNNEKHYKTFCLNCGKDFEVSGKEKLVTCPLCGLAQPFKIFSPEKTVLLRDGARLKHNGYFREAKQLYLKAIDLDPTTYEAYWGAFLADYCVKYFQDDVSKAFYPTCHNVGKPLATLSDYYLKACDYADLVSKAYYEEEAVKIEEIQKKALIISKTSESFDVFLLYRSKDEFGRPTEDFKKAQEVYEILKKLGYKVFFATEYLKDKDCVMFEPYIYRALTTSKILVTISSLKNNLNFSFVHNELQRFMDYAHIDGVKKIINCYAGEITNALPNELLSYPAISLDDSNFKENLKKAAMDAFSPSKLKTLDKKVLKLLDQFKEALDGGLYETAREIRNQVEKLTDNCFKLYQIDLENYFDLPLKEALDSYFKVSQTLVLMRNRSANINHRHSYNEDELDIIDLIIKLAKTYHTSPYIDEEALQTMLDFDMQIIDRIIKNYDIGEGYEFKYRINPYTKIKEIENICFDEDTKIGSYTARNHLKPEDFDKVSIAYSKIRLKFIKIKYLYFNDYQGYLEYLERAFNKTKDLLLIPASHVMLGDELYRLTGNERVYKDTYEDLYNMLVKINDKEWGVAKYNPAKDRVGYSLFDSLFVALNRCSIHQDYLEEIYNRYFDYECKKEIRYLLDSLLLANNKGIYNVATKDFLCCNYANYNSDALTVIKALKHIIFLYYDENLVSEEALERSQIIPLEIIDYLDKLKKLGDKYYANEVVEAFYGNKEKGLVSTAKGSMQYSLMKQNKKLSFSTDYLKSAFITNKKGIDPLLVEVIVILGVVLFLVVISSFILNRFALRVGIALIAVITIVEIIRLIVLLSQRMKK